MTDISTEQTLLEWLVQQRWFGGKGRDIAGIRIDTLGITDGEEACLDLVLATVDYADGEAESYQVPLSLYSEPQEQLAHASVGLWEIEGETRYGYDAPQDRRTASAWLASIARKDTAGAVSFHVIEGNDVATDLLGRVMGAEQSNTSIVFGDEYILKLFRKLAPGLNPDLEISRALADVGCEYIAPPLGWVEAPLPGAESEPATLGLLQPFLRSASEGWALATASVRDLFAEADLHADEVGGDFAAESERLGVATAVVHSDLARALDSHVAGPEESRATAREMTARLEAAVAVVPELAPFADAVRAAYEQVSTLPGEIHIQRVHGDYHLGQVLRTDTGWILLDFEGEPARPLSERRGLMSPLRDVAGMLRSFDYAARHLLAENPSSPGLQYRATEWAERNRNAFCDGYASAVGDDPRDSAVLLRAFELDKAIYEVVYEARNRPSWLPIPLGSIERLVG